jgi:RNA polymerase sigma-70 factor (ECF subfamily)
LHTNRKAYPQELSDEILMARVARGDPSALENLYDRHAAMVLGLCLKIMRDHRAAEQILQETFWLVWQSAPLYQTQPGHFTGWLFRLARQLANGAIRKIE